VITEIGKAKKAPDLFDPIEIRSRTGDPMAVGIIGEEKPRYFSIVRWGDAKLTLAQVKKRLHVEKWLLLLTATGGDRFFRCDVGLPWPVADREMGENAPVQVLRYGVRERKSR
jgi:hypothetical protein